jgi:predicted HicB family RNase H-like nuclease
MKRTADRQKTSSGDWRTQPRGHPSRRKDQRFAFRLNADLADALRESADHREQTVSEFVVEAIREHVKRTGKSAMT